MVLFPVIQKEKLSGPGRRIGFSRQLFHVCCRFLCFNLFRLPPSLKIYTRAFSGVRLLCCPLGLAGARHEEHGVVPGLGRLRHLHLAAAAGVLSECGRGGHQVGRYDLVLFAEVLQIVQHGLVVQPEAHDVGDGLRERNPYGVAADLPISFGSRRFHPPIS